MHNEFFFQLTPEKVLEAVEAGGFRPTGHCWALNSLENRVYDLRLEDDRHVVVKFYRPGRWSREQILEEHSFLFELRDADIPVCAPLELPAGGTLGEAADIVFAIWPRTGGRMTDELNEEQAAILGRLVARIHNVGAAGPPRHRLELNAESYGLGPLRNLRETGHLPELLADRYAAAVEAVVARYNELARDVPVHRIHGDCHAGNLLHGDEGFFFLDFDDFVLGPAEHVMWEHLAAKGREGQSMRENFREEYRRKSSIGELW